MPAEAAEQIAELRQTMKVRVVNRRLTGAGMFQSRQDNIFSNISDVAAPQAATSPLPTPKSAEVLHPSAFLVHRKERVTKRSPAQLQGMSCAGADSIVITRSGAKAASDIRVGDMLLTRDNGFQPVLWMKHVAGSDAAPMTVEIKIDAISAGIPGSCLFVSGRQAILLTCSEIMEQFGSAEILVRAGDLLHLNGIAEATDDFEGVVLMTPRHELISVNGMWVESFAPDSTARKCLSDKELEEVLCLVPGLTDLPFERSYPSARTVLRSEFARQFTR
ncbi:MAG: Hint domain-containing protein [Pseudomonadota bacterium]|nr:Hint domain-containing protein [Pseudomonadota bacterium]